MCPRSSTRWNGLRFVAGSPSFARGVATRRSGHSPPLRSSDTGRRRGRKSAGPLRAQRFSNPRAEEAGRIGSPRAISVPFEPTGWIQAPRLSNPSVASRRRSANGRLGGATNGRRSLQASHVGRHRDMRCSRNGTRRGTFTTTPSIARRSLVVGPSLGPLGPCCRRHDYRHAQKAHR